MNHNKDLDYFRAVLICLMILVHVVHFGDLYPGIKNAILAFMMPAFLVITGYLVNVNKSAKDFLVYLWQIFLPYVLLVTGFAVLSLYLPVRDGIKTFDVATMTHLIFIKSIGPYWFFHTMMVCGILYYASFHLSPKLELTVKFLLFGALIIMVSLWTPFLNIKAAAYYYFGVGVRLYLHDFSRIYRRSWRPVFLFVLLISIPSFQDWGTLSVFVSVLCFFCFASYFVSLSSHRTKDVMGYIGRNTFPIYCFHPIFTMLSKFMLPWFKLEPSGIVHALFTVGMSVVGCLYLAKLSDATHLSYVFGKKKLLR